MKGDVYGDYIRDYAAASPETWVNNSSGQASQFGFGITNGSLSAANTATGYTSCSSADSCFAKAPTTTPKTIVTVGTHTPIGGDTFTLKFRVHIPANSSPLVTEDWYTATTTVTTVAL